MKYEIYQIDSIRDCEYAFRAFCEAKDKLKFSDYKLMYSGETENRRTNQTVLEHLFEVFNINRPIDFKGHSLSVSDIVILYGDDEVNAYYCDSYDWKNITRMIFDKNNNFLTIPNMMSQKDMIDYLLDELKEQKQKMLIGEENRYSYIFMLCNDMGITEEGQ